MDLTELLAFVVKNKASDLHLSSGLPPMIRVHGDVRRINVPAMEHKEVHAMIYDIMNDGQRKYYEENLECDFSFAVPNLARFRVNAFVRHRAGHGPDRLGQVHHARGDGEPHQRQRARPHPHH
jgi:twitching motility protein PilT